MKTVIIAVSAAICCIAFTFFIMNMQLNRQKATSDHELLLSVEKTVQKRIGELSSGTYQQLQSLADVIASQKDFSLRILVENDRSSPYITEMASQFLHPMGFSVLEIADSSYTILSSGHFPASAGNSCAEKAKQLSSSASACIENIMGKPTLTFQARSKFSIAGFIFYVMGGMVIDTTLLKKLTPNKNVTILLKNGNEYIGRNDIRSISAIKDNHIIINDKKHLASSIEFPSSGLDSKLELVILLKK